MVSVILHYSPADDSCANDSGAPESGELIMEWEVLSPDGLPIQPNPFANEKEANDGLNTFIERYRGQGFYSAAYGRIPIADLADQCEVRPVQ